MESISTKGVARICGVGVSVVSRTINNHPGISPETRGMIMQMIKEHNYIPNNSVRNLKRTDSKAIAALIKGINNPSFSKMIRIFEKEIHRKKYSPIMQYVDAGEDEVDVALELIKEKKPRGIVSLGGFFSHSKKKLEQLVIPFVLSTIGMTDLLEELPFYSWVSVDDFTESYKTTNYLCEPGHKRILIPVATKDDESIGRLRLEGHREALKDNGTEPDEALCVSSGVGKDCYTMDYGFMAISRILEEKKTDFTAVYAILDSIAIGACKAITEYGVRIPEDYSVAGFDGLDIAHCHNPTLTTVRQPVEEMAEATTKTPSDVASSHADHRKRVFKAELTEGESTRNVKQKNSVPAYRGVYSHTSCCPQVLQVLSDPRIPRCRKSHNSPEAQTDTQRNRKALLMTIGHKWTESLVRV